MKKEHLPNMVTGSRILLSIILFFLPPSSAAFAVLYLLCGFTDVLDGVLARKLKAETRFGARLDSLADVFMSAVIIVTIVRQTQIGGLVLLILCVVFAVRVGSAVLSKCRFGRVASIHTLANKLTGLLLFFCPLGFAFAGSAGVVSLYITGLVALLASGEEFLILLKSDHLDLNRRSIFMKEKR